MKKKRLVIRTIILLILGATVAYTLYANFTKDDVKKVAIGEKAPDFVLMDMNGEKHRLSDYEGQGVFLNFWGTWCKPCEREMPYMDNQYKEFKDKGVTILAVNVGESDLAVQKFSDKHNLTFPILKDTDGQVQTAYKISPLPATYMIDKDGKVVKYHTGELSEDMIRDMMEQVKP
ncbi:thiol-disulfide oxidoreductase ResA [Bacillus sp. DTU_2020_1000418_1_SI_GHA_SEK_038]|uniref:thiol-disulfide oxidoreductase ResA n=1 Tax=Bacillus sp. DTU_2020_1000418_1_SI_GHA_SEK_038 TaxID=3077585 RepID=UPI0028E9F895|nr:thiol-disulfide oxidoreductase ResA [Bacillus sp. DTU_2020_1000418_1_SI_GHA_SEK_038]WNS74084.1 thiol-disulfide oxidoreductase ResA [Bacillus sp. DTU_2020_1000418_1_SI_GHA_SEK_038]